MVAVALPFSTTVPVGCPSIRARHRRARLDEIRREQRHRDRRTRLPVREIHRAAQRLVIHAIHRRATEDLLQPLSAPVPLLRVTVNTAGASNVAVGVVAVMFSTFVEVDVITTLSTSIVGS